jgi:hypothetical protein
MYDAYLQRIDECDQALEQHLKTFADKERDPAASDERVPAPGSGAVQGPSGDGKRAATRRSLTSVRNSTASAAST